jgi:hypothetical protein
MPFGVSKGQKAFFFGYFFSSKYFNYIAKDAHILHFKSSGNDKPNYFPASTPS